MVLAEREELMNKRVMIVDDDYELSQMVKALLEKEGYSVLLAYDGEEALELLANHNIDLLILDVMMPTMSGYEVCRRLRESTFPVTFSIIMLTGKSSIDDKIVGLDMGADDYLTKPFDVLELLARVRAQMRIRDLQERLVNMEKLATIGQMTITLSDQINNPLASMLWHISLLKKELENQQAPSPTVINAVAAIEKAVHSINEVMTKLRKVRRPVSKEFSPGIRMLDLDKSSTPSK